MSPWPEWFGPPASSLAARRTRKPPPEAMAKARTEGVEQAKAVTFQMGDFVKKIVAAFFGVAFVAALALLGVLIVAVHGIFS